MTLNERYRAIYMRLYGFKDFCDEQHNNVMRELEKEIQSLRPEVGLPSHPVLGECEDCGHKIVTPLHHFPDTLEDAKRWQLARYGRVDGKIITDHRWADLWDEQEMDAVLRQHKSQTEPQSSEDK